MAKGFCYLPVHFMLDVSMFKHIQRRSGYHERTDCNARFNTVEENDNGAR
jgi:hypothetical protein